MPVDPGGKKMAIKACVDLRVVFGSFFFIKGRKIERKEGKGREGRGKKGKGREKTLSILLDVFL